MTYNEFLKIPELAKVEVRESTLQLWHQIYIWVLANGYADTADSPEFVKHIQSFRKIEVKTIGRHLRIMSEIGLLAQHSLRRKLSQEAKEELLNPLVGLFFGGSSLPSAFTRYALPGRPCPREFKAAQRSLEKIETRMNEFRTKTPFV